MTTSLDHTRLTALQQEVERVKRQQGTDDATTFHLALLAIGEMRKAGFLRGELTPYELDCLIQNLQQQYRNQPFIRQKEGGSSC